MTNRVRSSRVSAWLTAAVLAVAAVIATVALISHSGAANITSNGGSLSGPASSSSLPDPIAAAKSSMVAAERSSVENLPRRPKPTSTAATSPNVPPSDSVPTGVLNLKEAPFPASSFDVQNRYQVYLDSGFYIVFAGATYQADHSTLAAAAIRVMKVEPGEDPETGALQLVGDYISPDPSGALRVVSGSGPTVTLTNTGNMTETFDITTLKFTEPNRSTAPAP